MQSQTNVIAGALLVGFLVFVTTRGELPDYVRLFTAKRPVQGGSSGGSFFGLNVPGLSKKDEANAEDKAIDTAGQAILGDYWTIGDKFI